MTGTRSTRVCSWCRSSASFPRSTSACAAASRRSKRELLVDGCVLRYRSEECLHVDGLPPGEGAFLLCTFWLADNYALAGRWDEARAVYERLLALRNDLGLLSEQVDPRTGRMLGNFPQAFSHVGLVNTARNLSREGGPAHQRPHAGE